MRMADRLLLSAVFFGALVLSGCGYGGSDAVGEPSGQPTAVQEAAAENYLLSADARFSLVSDDESLDRATVELPAGSEVVIIERRVDAGGETLIRIGIDTEPGSGQPSDIWVRATDVPDYLLTPFIPEDDADLLEDSWDGGISDLFSAARRKMTYCYRHVKLYLLRTGQVKTYLPGVSAYQAADILPRYGFRRTRSTPATAKNGEICVYAGGPKGHGHIEVKRNGKWWYGYGFKSRPIANRRFLGCFVK
jgi:hypothetical protein